MTYTELPIEERIEINKRIEIIIGTKESWIRENMSTSERINTRFAYDKLKEKLQKVFLMYGDKALAMNFMDYGGWKKGVTPNGKRWTLEMNSGWTTRSRHCGTLFIEGQGMIFTSGTLAKAFEYIFNN